MARSPTFPPTASTRQQRRMPPPTPNARPAPKRCTRRSGPPLKPPCILQKRKSLLATLLRALPCATVECLEIHSALHSPLHSAPCGGVPKNKKTPPPSKSAKPQPAARLVRSGPESAKGKEDRKPLPPADHIHVRRSANTKACRNAAKFQAMTNANRRAPANSR